VAGESLANDLSARLAEIERALDAGSYRPGPWEKFLAEARRRPDAERAALAGDVSRVSRKLHLRGGRSTIPFGAALAAEVVAAVIGGMLVIKGATAPSIVAAWIGAVLWMMAFQPLVKIAAGAALGVGYEYAYLMGIEPRFKMRYGSYLAAPRWNRVVLHLAGTAGSPIGVILAAEIVATSLPWTAALMRAVFWILVAVNFIPFVAALFGVRRLGPMRMTDGSGGLAGLELHEAMRG